MPVTVAGRRRIHTGFLELPHSPGIVAFRTGGTNSQVSDVASGVISDGLPDVEFCPQTDHR